MGIAELDRGACLGLGPWNYGEPAIAVVNYCALGVHACPYTFIGHVLDTVRLIYTKYLISLALPRGLEPLFSP